MLVHVNQLTYLLLQNTQQHADFTLSHKQLGQLYVTIIYHNTIKPNTPILDWMFSSSSWFVHLQNKQKQIFASENHVGTTSET